MRRKTILFLILCFAAMLFAAPPGGTRTVSGTTTIRLKKPLTKDVSDQLRGAAITAFKIDLWEWMAEEADVTVDTGNAIQRYHFNTFADSCLFRAKTVQSLAGRDVTLSITVPGEDVRALLEASNSKYYAISMRFYTIMKSALEEKAISRLYNLGILAIYYSLGRMGSPIGSTGASDESTPRSFLLDDARSVMQAYFNKFALRSEEFIITGKPGTVLAAPIKVRAIIDTAPLPGITIVGVLPGGKKVCEGVTGPDGSVEFRGFRIPYVAKGSSLILKPDLSAGIPGVTPFDARDLGINLPDQTLMFNIIPATYSLSYKANAVSVVTIPKDFAGDAYVNKYLHDSCFLTPAVPGGKTDLYISMTNQVSAFARDESEDTLLRVENDIIIEDASRKALSQRQGVAFEKAYESSIKVPYGLFFWEAAGRSMRALKEMIRGL
jgi:hypothetical protein